MNSRIETGDHAVASNVTTSLVGAVRHAVLATAVALPVTLLAALDGFESDSECASAGELWLDVQARMRVSTERIS